MTIKDQYTILGLFREQKYMATRDGKVFRFTPDGKVEVKGISDVIMLELGYGESMVVDVKEVIYLDFRGLFDPSKKVISVGDSNWFGNLELE